MTDKTIKNIRGVGGDYFLLYYLRSSKNNLEYFLTFDKNDYWIYKSSDHQREVSYEEMLEFKYSQYIFFKKQLYNKVDINKWLKWFYDNNLIIKFLDKGFLPIYMIDRIKIKK